MSEPVQLDQQLPLGERLREAGVITQKQLDLALRHQKREGGRLGEILTELGLAKSNVISSFLAEETATKFVDVRENKVNLELRHLIPEAIARRYSAFPMSREGDILCIALGDPFNVVATDMIEQITGLSIKVVTGSEADIALCLDRLYAEGDQIEESIDTIMDESAEKARAAVESGKEQSMGGDESMSDLVQQLLTRAIDMGASDLHFNPEENALALRLRVDGVLQQDVMMPKKLQAPLIARLKIMAEMNVAETRIPQDGRAGILIGQREISLRVSTLPTVWGENIVIRVLDPAALDLGLAEMGFRPEVYEQLTDVISKPNGVVMVTGPTGSGKSTTLYAILAQLNKPDVSIFTLEDPVEYRLNMIRQTQINDKVGMTFNMGLRALLRQDPEIILVGETRDQETAELMVRAALTGHLVFTTLHTNDAASCIPRLIDMGVEPYLLPSCLQGALAQRLARRACKHCKEEEPDPEQVFSALGLTPPEGQPLNMVRAVGCGKCRDSGYKGRVGIHELMVFDERYYVPICAKAESSVYIDLAREKGFLTMFEDGIIKAMQGQTTVKEILRCTRDH
ncbi:MAG: type IV pilus assembly protein PilB [Verrucomicrobiales bacterium]|jgi:type IV pilus assembly protein PilB